MLFSVECWNEYTNILHQPPCTVSPSQRLPRHGFCGVFFLLVVELRHDLSSPQMRSRVIIHKYLLGVLSACSPQTRSSGHYSYVSRSPSIGLLTSFWKLDTPFPTDGQGQLSRKIPHRRSGCGIEDPLGDGQDCYSIGAEAPRQPGPALQALRPGRSE